MKQVGQWPKESTTPGLLAIPEQPQGNLNPAPPGAGNCTVQLLTLNELGSSPKGHLRNVF